VKRRRFLKKTEKENRKKAKGQGQFREKPGEKVTCKRARNNDYSSDGEGKWGERKNNKDGKGGERATKKTFQQILGGETQGKRQTRRWHGKPVGETGTAKKGTSGKFKEGDEGTTSYGRKKGKGENWGLPGGEKQGLGVEGRNYEEVETINEKNNGN